MKKFSIIVPVYQVEKYIRACVESIFRQGLDDDVFEVIIVNDGSTDHSMQQIADLIGQHSNIIVLEQENQGLSMARNNGMKNANGDYIIFLWNSSLTSSWQTLRRRTTRPFCATVNSHLRQEDARRRPRAGKRCLWKT